MPKAGWQLSNGVIRLIRAGCYQTRTARRKRYPEKRRNCQCFDGSMFHAPGLIQQQPFHIRISSHIFCCGGLASNKEDFYRLISCSSGCLFLFRISCTNWYVSTVKLKIPLEESNKADSKNATKVGFKSIGFSPSAFSGGTERFEMSDTLWTPHLLTLMVSTVWRWWFGQNQRWWGLGLGTGVGYVYLHREVPLQVGISPLSDRRGKWIFFPLWFA